jgi:predicted short-subunit dehydrogenase-like oxidoreductase (DUF2520 family)
MKIGFIGAGKVGFSLGKYFCEHGLEVTGYYSRNFQSAKEAAAFTSSAAYENRSELVANSDVLFLTVTDCAIADTYAAVCEEDIRGKIICHCSGALTAESVFSDIEWHGAAGFSVHPLIAVSSRYDSYRQLADVFFTLEGTESKREEFREWLKTAGLNVQCIPADAKVKYHCAAAIASNQVIALFAQSQQLLMECGFSQDTARQALVPLFLGNARQTAESGPANALTGPVERGDKGTIEKHLKVLDCSEDKLLYLLLSKKLLKTAKEKHPSRDYSSIENFINAETEKI